LSRTHPAVRRTARRDSRARRGRRSAAMRRGADPPAEPPPRCRSGHSPDGDWGQP
jgi:hypothetical protein